MDQTPYLFIKTVMSIIFLLVLGMRLKLHAFTSLLLASTFVGHVVRIPFMERNPHFWKRIISGHGDFSFYSLSGTVGKIKEGRYIAHRER